MGCSSLEKTGGADRSMIDCTTEKYTVFSHAIMDTLQATNANAARTMNTCEIMTLKLPQMTNPLQSIPII